MNTSGKGRHKPIKLNEHTLGKLVDILREVPSFTDAGRCVGISTRTIFHWRDQAIAAKKENDTSSIFWMCHGGTWGFWHDLVGKSRAEHLMIAEAKIRQQAVDGIEELVFGPTQQPVWREDPKYIGRSDQYIRDMEILAPDDDVAWYRLLHDESGNPIQLTRRVQIPAPLRKSILSASHSDYRETVDISVRHSGTVAISKPLERLASEPRADVSELRRLASMSAEERRAYLNAEAVPVNSRGQPIAPNVGDAEAEPLQLMPPNPVRPSYAKPLKPLDTSGRGRGEPPPGGFKLA